MKKITLFLFLVLSHKPAFSQSSQFSTGSGNWNDPFVWNTNTIPSANTDVVISAGHTVTLDGAINMCHHLQIDSSSTLLAMPNITLFINGDWQNSGYFDCNTAMVNFSGAAAQSLSGNTNTQFYDLELNNSAGLQLQHSQSIKGTLYLNTGTLTTGANDFIFLSDQTNTARIAEIPTGADIIGNITMQRYVASNAVGWRLLGVPVTGASLQDWADDFVTSGFSGSAYPNFNFCSIYTYDETVGGTSDLGYLAPLTISQNVPPGLGHWAYIGPTPTLIEVTGAPVKQNHNFMVSYTSSGGANEDGWNLIANPYPSAIDWDSPAWSKSGINNAIYIWDPALAQYSSYVNGIGVNGGTNIITSSQGFWVQANQNNPVLAASEAVKTNADAAFWRPAQNNLTVLKLIMEGNGYKDETALCFSLGANNNYNPNEDAIKMFSDDPNGIGISSLSGGEEIMINFLSENTYTLPIRVITGTSGVYTLKKDTSWHLPENTCLYLEDLCTNSKFDLSGDSAATFSFYLQDTTQAPRFLLHLAFPLKTQYVSPSCSYLGDGMAIAGMSASGPKTYVWKNAVGSTLAIHTTSLQQDTLFNLIPGSYFVEGLGGSSLCLLQSDSITINQKDSIHTTGIVQQVNCKYDTDGKIITSVSGALPPVIYNWSDGSMSKDLTQAIPGIYTLVLTDAAGCQDTASFEIKSLSALEIDFSVSQDTVNLNERVEFKSLSSHDLWRNWNFGDGNFNQADSFCSHAYSAPGVFITELEVADQLCVLTKTCEVVVLEAMALLQNWSSEKSVKIWAVDNQVQVAFMLETPREAIVEILTSDGRLVSRNSLLAHSSTETFPLGDSHDLYVIRVMVGKQVYTKKVTK